MDREPVVVDESTREWETWPEEEVSRKGLVYWRTLISGDVTRSEALTMGIGCPLSRMTGLGKAPPCRSTKPSMQGYKAWRNFRERLFHALR